MTGQELAVPEPEDSIVYDPQTGTMIDTMAANGEDVVEFIRPADRPEFRRELTHMTTSQVLRYEPMTPSEIAYCIEEIQQALDRYALVYPSLVKARYDAERAYTLAKAEARLAAPVGGYNSDRSAYADVKSAAELEAFQLAKEKQYAADALEKALRSKLFGYLNLNNNLAALYNAAGHGH